MSEKEKDSLELADDFLLSDDKTMIDAVDLIERLYAELEDAQMHITLMCLEMKKLGDKFSLDE